MIRCPLCGAAVPRVHGADPQVCPECGAEIADPGVPPAAPRRRDTAGAAVRALRLVLARYPSWLLLYAPIALLSFALQAIEGVALQGAGWAGDVPAHPGTLALVVAVAVPFLLVEAGFGAAFLGAGAAVAARAARDGAAPRPLDGLRVLARRGHLLFVTGLLFVAVVLSGALAFVVPAVFLLLWYDLLLAAGLLVVAVVLSGALAFLAPAFVFLHWYLWTTAHVALGAGVGDSFRRSRALAAEPGMVAYTVLVVLAWAGVYALRYAGATLLEPALGGGPVALALGWTLAGWPLFPLVPALVGSLLAEAVPETAPAAPAAQPEPAASTRRVLRCPGCGSVVDVPPGEGPRRVVCAECGRAGVVR